MQYLRTLRHSGEVTLLGLNWAHFVWFEGAYGSVHNATTYMNFTFPDVIICTEIENPPDGAGTPFKTCRLLVRLLGGWTSVHPLDSAGHKILAVFFKQCERFCQSTTGLTHIAGLVEWCAFPKKLHP
ncbi:uncharacterized protein ACWYII_004539 isoform 1-T1 [Salvelinus alpinus]